MDRAVVAGGEHGKLEEVWALADICDYVIVGAGSAGCVVAGRLTEKTAAKVILIEAGARAATPWEHIPLGYGKLFMNPSVNWMMESVPEPGIGNRVLYQPRGKALGGTSAINGMIYMRGHAEDYDEWRHAGCVGWGYDDVLPYFRRAEDNARGADTYHGTGGPLHVSDVGDLTELARSLVAAGQQAGLPYNPDFNGSSQEGVGYFQQTVKNGRRWSAARAYLDPAWKRSNLRVLSETHVLGILLEEGSAVGVRVRDRNGVREIRARAEVIVCAGAFGSPHLLMHSGIGPAAHLREMGIEVRFDAPGVGRNLQDHYYVQVMARSAPAHTANELFHSKLRQAAAAMQYVFRRRGPLAHTAFSVGFLARSSDRQHRPDLQLNFSPWTAATRTPTGIIPHDFPGFSLSPVHIRPEGRGWVKLKSPDPLDKPSLYFGVLSTEHDREALKAGVVLARRIMRQPALAKFFPEEIFPGNGVDTEEALDAWLVETAGSNFHPAGSCRMGSDAGSVVDHCLRVRGVGRLRIVDASIMPRLVAGNTNAPTMMIGEKAADMILESAKAG